MSDYIPRLCKMCRGMALLNDDQAEVFKIAEAKTNEQCHTTESHPALITPCSTTEPAGNTTDESIIDRVSPTDSAAVGSQDDIEDSETFERTMRTGWEVHDRLPELPILRSSLENGCELCGFLREAILSNDTKLSWTLDGFLSRARPVLPHLDVRIYLEYSWAHRKSHCTPGFGLERLKCMLESTDSKSWKPNAVQFHVEADTCEFRNGPAELHDAKQILINGNKVQDHRCRHGLVYGLGCHISVVNLLLGYDRNR